MSSELNPEHAWMDSNFLGTDKSWTYTDGWKLTFDNNKSIPLLFTHTPSELLKICAAYLQAQAALVDKTHSTRDSNETSTGQV